MGGSYFHTESNSPNIEMSIPAMYDDAPTYNIKTSIPPLCNNTSPIQSPGLCIENRLATHQTAADTCIPTATNNDDNHHNQSPNDINVCNNHVVIYCKFIIVQYHISLLQIDVIFEFDKFDNDISSALEFAKTVKFYEFSFDDEEVDIHHMSNTSVTMIFKYLITQPVFINRLNIEFARCNKASVIDYLKTLLDVGHSILSSEKKLGITIFNYFDIFNRLVYNIITSASERSFVDFLLETFNVNIDAKIPHVKTLMILKLESINNIFSVCKYFFNSMKNDTPNAVEFNICIILFLYFGVPGITRVSTFYYVSWAVRRGQLHEQRVAPHRRVFKLLVLEVFLGLSRSDHDRCGEQTVYQAVCQQCLRFVRGRYKKHTIRVSDSPAQSSTDTRCREELEKPVNVPVVQLSIPPLRVLYVQECTVHDRMAKRSDILSDYSIFKSVSNKISVYCNNHVCRYGIHVCKL